MRKKHEQKVTYLVYGGDDISSRIKAHIAMSAPPIARLADRGVVGYTLRGSHSASRWRLCLM